jgi:hypothetical protein
LDLSKIPTSKPTNQQIKSSFFFNTAQNFSQPDFSKRRRRKRRKFHNNNDNTTLHLTKTKASKAQLRSKLLILELYYHFF